MGNLSHLKTLYRLKIADGQHPMTSVQLALPFIPVKTMSEEAHYRDRTSGTNFVPFALETYGALSARSDRFFVECASLASTGCGGSGPSTSMLCTWF